MKLDVGCGNFPTGDVNCDLHIKDVGHRTGKLNKRTLPFNPHKIRNFVLCDIQHLPFRDSVFDEVFSSHVIEHVKNPILMLDEMVKVSRDLIVVECPHWLGDKLLEHNPYHISFFRMRWFWAFARSRKLFCKIEVVKRFGGLLGMFLNIPLGVRVELRKIARK